MARSGAPNILFITADQLAASFLGCYGSEVGSTPTLDRLAREGVRFDRCYATSPVCAPNRASILTGRSPVVHGVVTNNYTLRPDNPTWAQVLWHQGYRTGGFGKFHLAPMPLEHPPDYRHLGFDETVITEDPKWGEYIDWIEAEHPAHFETALAVAWGEPRERRPGDDPRRFGDELRAIRQRLLGPRREASLYPNAYVSPLPAELHQTAFITDRALDFLRRHRAEAAGQPFLCHVSYVDPHAPYDPPPPYAEMFDPARTRPATPAAWKESRSPALTFLHRWQNFHRVAADPAAVAQLRAYFHGELRFLDDQIARLVAWLEENDLVDETVLVFTTDHGDMLGDQELLAKGHTPYDAGIRCPLLVWGGGTPPATAGGLRCSLDLFPTFCDWAGVAPAARPPLEGRSFAPLCAGEEEAEPWPDVHVGFGSMDTLITADGWRLTLFDEPQDSDQLIHLAEDPDEQRNRYHDPAEAERRYALLRRLWHHHLQTRERPQYRNFPKHQDRRWHLGGPGKGNLCDPLPPYTPDPQPGFPC